MSQIPAPAPSTRPPASTPPGEPPVLELAGVVVRRGGHSLLGPVDWRVSAGERWVLLGPNGSGKTTLLRVASTFLPPSAGRVTLLGATLGRVDARLLRRRIGYESPALSEAIDPARTALEVVVTARTGALAPWWDPVAEADEARARDLLAFMGCAHLADRPVGSLSTGERQRVQIARALMPDPDLLLLDEPLAGLDVGARELLLERLAALARGVRPLAILLVTHHLEEVPPGFDRALLLADGRPLAAGPAHQVLTSSLVSRAFGLPLVVEQTADGRFLARRDGRLPPSPAAPPPPSGKPTAWDGP